MVVVRKIPESTTLNLDNLSRQVALSQNWPVIRLPTSTMATVACGSVFDIVHICRLLPPLNHLFAYPALILVSNWAAACLVGPGLGRYKIDLCRFHQASRCPKVCIRSLVPHALPKRWEPTRLHIDGRRRQRNPFRLIIALS